MPKYEEKWGRDEARARYGKCGTPMTGGTTGKAGQDNISDIDQLGPSYRNDVANNWLRGKGQEPGFDYGKKGK